MGGLSFLGGFLLRGRLRGNQRRNLLILFGVGVVMIVIAYTLPG